VTDRFLGMAHPGFAGVVAGVLAVCLVFGGATRAGFLGDTLVQLAAIPLLLWSIFRLRGRSEGLKWPLAFCVAVSAVPVLHLIPLPPSVWTALPLRDPAVASLELAQIDAGWRPLTLVPHNAWLALAGLIPALAMFLGTALMTRRERHVVVVGLLVLTVLSALLALVQAAARGSAAGETLVDASNARGFFVNRNHFAALCYIGILFAAALAADATRGLAAKPRWTWGGRDILPAVASGLAIIVLLAGVVVSTSRAGLGLAVVALLVGAAIANSDHRASALGQKRHYVFGAAALAFLFAAQFALLRVMERFRDPLGDARVTLSEVTWKAARELLPFGSGVGSFVPVYQLYETPALSLPGFYINRAHNELLDVMLETGLVGLLLIGLFGVWLVFRLMKIWRADTSWPLPVDALLARAAGCAIVLVLAHSLVDYPLRTAALSAVFAFACGMLVNPRVLRTDGSQIHEHDVVVEPMIVAEPARPKVPPQRQPFDIAWGERTPSQAPSPGRGSAQTSLPKPRPQSGSGRDAGGGEAAAVEGQQLDPKHRIPWMSDVEWPEAWRVSPKTKRDGDGGGGPAS
jgi:O-antigen ligase